MDYITVSAKTLDDAITEALIQLGVTSDQLDYEVIEKGSSGFLGIGMKQAVIRARKKKEVKEIKKEVKKEVKPEPVQVDDPKPEPVTTTNEETIDILNSTIDEVEKFMNDVLTAMKMENVKVTTHVDHENILCIDMEGDNMGLLIGKRGQTLDSLQYLANRVANKTQEGYVRVKLDTEDYRRRRKETLENLARNLASKVKRTKRPVSLEPMNPYERRIIHSYLQHDKYVSTHSEGSEPYRKVIITYVYK